MKYSLGLDLGIASIGWALMRLDEQDNIKRIENVGVRLFDCLEDGKTGKLDNYERRIKRGQRRLRRRKQYRLKKFLAFYQTYFDLNSTNVIHNNDKNRSETYVYDIKVKGLHEKLSNTELAIALYHYVKFRGFKSNRKVDDDEILKNMTIDQINEDDTDSDKKLLSGIRRVDQELIKRKITVTQYILDEFNKVVSTPHKHIRNSSDSYTNTFSRAMYLNEINLLLDKQISFGLIDESFKNRFIQIWGRQRDFSEGPDDGPYQAPKGSSMILQMIGKCQFDGNIRAPKCALSAERFVMLSSLVNLRYKVDEEDDYRKLSANELKLIDQYAFSKKTLTYKDIFKKIQLTYSIVRIKGQDLSKKKYLEYMSSFKKDNNLQNNQLNEEDYAKFQAYLLNKQLATKIRSLEKFHEFSKFLEKNLPEVVFSAFHYKNGVDGEVNSDNYDKLGQILTQNKTDDQIEKACNLASFSQEITNQIKKIKGEKEHIHLSLELCRNIVPYLLEGNSYDEALNNLGMSHTFDPSKVQSHDEIPPIDSMLDQLNDRVANPNVRHMLVEARKLINAIIRMYGKPYKINVELARDLSKNFLDRREEQRAQIENAEVNINTRIEIFSKYPLVFKNIYSINHEDVLRYKLYKEQKGVCPYSQEHIPERELFNRTVYEVDHIVPYSRSFDDSFTNKALVLTKSNQEKKNQLPYEAFKGNKWLTFENFIRSNHHQISNRKKENYLLKSIDKDFISRNINDTRYASRLMRKIIITYLKPNDSIVLSGRITSHLKTRWGLNGFQHSLINSEMRNIYTYSFPRNLDFINISNQQLKVQLQIEETKELVTFGLSKIQPKKDKQLSVHDIRINEVIDFVTNQEKMIVNTIENSPSRSVDNVYVYCYQSLSNNQDVNNQTFYSNMIQFINLIMIFISEEKSSKNRDNHLHHAVDAVVIACCDAKMVKRVTEYYKLYALKQLNSATMRQDDIDLILGVTSKSKFPLPYADIKDDVKNRIYQRDRNIMRDKIKNINACSDVDANYLANISVLYPSRSPIEKKTGKLHKETIYGEVDGTITQRISVRKLKPAQITDIVNISHGSDDIIQAIKQWMNNTEEQRKNSFPVHPTKGNFIKKVRIVESDNPDSKIKLGDKRYVDSADVLRIDVYKKRGGDDKLVFVPYNMWNITKENSSDERNVNIFWARGDNGRSSITIHDLKSNYQLVTKIKKGNLIEIMKKDGNRGIGYCVGFSSGILEIKSVLGDGTDLVSSYRICESLIERYQFTITTIQEIKVLNISMLGKITENGLPTYNY